MNEEGKCDYATELTELNRYEKNIAIYSWIVIKEQLSQIIADNNL